MDFNGKINIRKIKQMNEQEIIEPKSAANNNLKNYIDLILKTCDFFDAEMHDLISPSRTRSIAFARFYLWKYAFDSRRYSLEFIAKHTGGRHHTTVISGVRTLNNLLSYDDEIKNDYLNFYKLINQ